MEDHSYYIPHASQQGDMGSIEPHNAPFPPHLLAQCDPSLESPKPPFPPHLHTHDYQHRSQCAQQQCCPGADTTCGIDAQDCRKSHIKSHGDFRVDENSEAVRLDLSLRYGGHHQAQPSLLVGAIREHSSSSVTDLNDRSNGDLAATHPSSAASVFVLKSSEGESWGNTCSSSTNHMLEYTHSHHNGCDFDALSQTTRGHSAFQTRVDKSQGSPCDSRTLPAKGAFVPSHDEKVFFCKFCDRRFHSSQALGGHQNAHKRERLVARSTPRFGAPPFYCAGLPGMSIQFPYAASNMQQHLASLNEDGSQACPQMVATVCKDRYRASSLVSTRHEERHQSPMLVTTMCKDRFQSPPLVSIMCNSGLECMPSNSAYMCNRSLGIKAHSLVHKPAADDSFTPRIGHLKALTVMPAPSQVSTAHNKWSRASIDAQPGVARCFAPAQDHIHHRTMQAAARFEGSMSACHHHDARFPLHKDAPALLHHHRHGLPFHRASHTKPFFNPSRLNSGFLQELESSSPVVDLALRL